MITKILAILGLVQCVTTNVGRKRPIVRQNPDDINYETPTSIDDYFAVANVFLGGMSITNFVPNAYACSDAAYEFVSNLNQTVNDYTLVELQNDTVPALQAYTQLVSGDFAKAQLDCELSYVDYIVYTQDTIEKFGNSSNWFQGFLQNMVGQLVSLNKLYSNIQTSTENGDYKAVYHYSGRTVYLLINFDPIDFAALDEDSMSTYEKVFALMNLGQSIQNRINDGSIPLDDVVLPFHPMVGQEETTDEEVGASFFAEAGVRFFVEAQGATIGATSDNLNFCSGNVTQFGVEYANSTAQSADGNLTLAAYSRNDVIKSIDPIIFSCYFTLFEYAGSMGVYVGTITHFDRLLYNIAHNLGNIYDLVEEGIVRTYRARDDDETNGEITDIDYWSRMGFISGSIFENLFQEPSEYFHISDEELEQIMNGDYVRE